MSDDSVTGLGLRAAEFAEVLSQVFDVHVICADSDRSNLLPVGQASTHAGGDPGWVELVTASDIVILFDVVPAARLEVLRAAGASIVSDVTPPIEQAGYASLRAQPDRHLRYNALVADYRLQLQMSHHFIARSAVERATLVTALLMVGRVDQHDLSSDPTLSSLITTVPIGFSDGSLSRARSAPTRDIAEFAWTGGLWAFHRACIAIRAIGLLRTQSRTPRLHFLCGSNHLDSVEALAEAREAIRECNLHDVVTIESTPTLHTSRDSLLKNARGFVCLAARGVENDTAIRLRVRDSFLYGRPLLIDPFGATADLSRTTNLVRPVRDLTPELVAAEMDRLLTGSEGPEIDEGYSYEFQLRPLIERFNS